MTGCVEAALAGALFASGFSIVVAQILALLAIVVWLATPRRRGGPQRWPLLGPYVAWLAASLLSALASEARLDALLALRGEAIPPLLFYAALSRPAGRGFAARLVTVLLVTGSILGLLGLVQVAEHGLGFRAQGTLGHYMTYAGVLLLAVLSGLGRTILAWDRRGGPWVAAAVGLAGVGLLLSQTRGAWIGWICGSAVVLALRDRRLLVALPVLATLVVVAAPAGARARIRAAVEGRDATSIERVFMWRAGMHIVRDHPLLGVGPGQVRHVYPGYRLPDDPWLPERRFSHLHDNVLQIAAERGLPALAAWLWLWLAFFRDARRTWRGLDARDARGRALVAGAVAALVGFLVAGITEYNHGDTEVLYVATLLMAVPYLAAAEPPCDGTAA